MVSEIEEFQAWLRRKAPQASTAVHYGSDLKLFFMWLGKPPLDVKVQDVDTFIEHAQTEGHSIATINRRLYALRSFYSFLSMQSDQEVRNPVIPRRHYIHRGRLLPRDVEDDLLEGFFAVVKPTRDRAMFMLMLRCGLRVGEVRNLSLRDLYLDPSQGNLPRLWLHGKGNKERVVYLSSQALVALENWLHERPVSGDDAVFLNRFSRRLSVTGIQDRLAKYCKKAGLWITCHQFRHTFGRHLTESGTPVTSIQRMLGHTCLKSTEVYLHISDRQVQADYQKAMQGFLRKLADGEKSE